MVDTLHRVAAALGLVAAVAAGSPAKTQAQAEDADARVLFEQGRAAYEREIFTEAEDAFRAAYEAMEPENPRRPLVLVSLALSIERQGGRDEDALEAWRRFEREGREVADDGALLRASNRIRELEARLRRRHQEADGAEEGPTLTEVAEPEEPGFSPHWSGIVVTGVGGAAVLAGAIVGIAGLAKRSSVLDMCDGTVCPPEARDDASRLDGLALGADLLIWPGLAIAAAGVVLMFTVSSNDDGTVTASCGLGGCMVRGTF